MHALLLELVWTEHGHAETPFPSHASCLLGEVRRRRHVAGSRLQCSSEVGRATDRLSCQRSPAGLIDMLGFSHHGELRDLRRSILIQSPHLGEPP